MLTLQICSNPAVMLASGPTCEEWREEEGEEGRTAGVEEGERGRAAGMVPANTELSVMSLHVHKITLPSSSASSACGKLSGPPAILEYPLFTRCFLLGGGCSGTPLLAGRLGGQNVRGVHPGIPTQCNHHYVLVFTT